MLLGMPWGSIVALLAFVAVSFHLADGALARLRLRPFSAGLLCLSALFGRALPPVVLSPGFRLAAGVLIPLVLALLLLPHLEATGRRRTLVGGIAGGAAAGVLLEYLPNEPGMFVVELEYVLALAAGVTAFIFSHGSREGLAAGGLAGALHPLFYRWFGLLRSDFVPPAAGDGLSYDIAVLAALLAFLLAELGGETREQLQRRLPRGAASTGTTEMGEQR